MGMPIGIDVRDPDVDPAALDRAFDWLRWVDATFSTYKADSEISRLNRGELALADAHPDVRAVLRAATSCARRPAGTSTSASAYLFTVGATRAMPRCAWGRRSVGAGQRAGRSTARRAILDAAGARNYAINAGGDIRVRGRPGTRPALAHRHPAPLAARPVAAVVAATDLAIATSGAYERGDAHRRPAHRPHRPSGVLSVTIVGPDLATADAYATAAYAMGRDGPDWTARRSPATRP